MSCLGKPSNKHIARGVKLTVLFVLNFNFLVKHIVGEIVIKSPYKTSDPTRWAIVFHRAHAASARGSHIHIQIHVDIYINVERNIQIYKYSGPYRRCNTEALIWKPFHGSAGRSLLPQHYNMIPISHYIAMYHIMNIGPAPCCGLTPGSGPPSVLLCCLHRPVSCKIMKNCNCMCI